MATEVLGIARPSNTYLDGLVWGDMWNVSTGPITFRFGTGRWSLNEAPAIRGTGHSWTAAEKGAFIIALQQWADVCDVKFKQGAGSTDTVFYLDNKIPALGISDTPSSPGAQLNTTVLNDRFGFWDNLKKGGFAFELIHHEIGHMLGLAHPHDTGGASSKFPGVSGDYDTGTYGLNQDVWTVMSYVSYSSHKAKPLSFHYGNISGPMAFDIAAVQAIYGANMSYHAGNNGYALPKSNNGASYWCIWDAGGSDSISAAGSSRSAVIDLRDAPLEGPKAGGYISSISGVVGGCTIANGVTIEKAIGGNANDKITGNEADNRLFGNGGNDKIKGDDGNDVINGGIGIDTLSGGVGNDTFYVDSSKDKITDSSGSDEVRSTVSINLSTMAGGEIEDARLQGSKSINAVGSAENNLLIGNNGNNVLSGNGGDDTLSGGLGRDRLNGGIGNDVANGGAGNDVLGGDDGDDTLIGGAGSDLLNGGAGNDWLEGNTGSDTLRGDIGDDTLVIENSSFLFVDGGSGSDSLKVNGSGITLDLTTISDTALQSIEQIDLTGNGGNAIVLDATEVLNLSDTNQLVIDGNGDDVVSLDSSFAANGTKFFNGETYNLYQSGLAEVLVDQSVSVTIS